MQDEKAENEAAKRLIRVFMEFKRSRPVENDVASDPPGFDEQCRLKHSEVMILFALAETEREYPEGISVSDLSRHLHVKSPSITPLIANLEDKNMVRRSIDLNDRRIVRVKFEEDGLAFVKKAHQRFLSKTRRLVSYLGEEKTYQLADLLEQVNIFFVNERKSKHHP